MSGRAQEVLEFWLEEVGPSRWYDATEALDAEIRARFETDWEAARDGRLDAWRSRPDTALALLILLDQFPRNMFRGTGRAFSTDRIALGVAKQAIARGHDMRTPEPQRQFFYLPLMHSESPADQNRCVTLFAMRMPGTGAQNLLHARVHREIIRRFGRFPTRNAALGRTTSTAEQAHLAGGGYDAILKALAA